MDPSAYDPPQFPPFAVTVDVMLTSIVDEELHLVLIERGNEPYSAGSSTLSVSRSPRP